MADTRKKAHTLLVERLEEVAMPSHGRAIEIVTKQQRWVLFPCAKGTDRVLSDEAAAIVSDEWFGLMDEAHTTVKKRRASMASGDVSDVVLQQLHVDLWDVDNEWCVSSLHLTSLLSSPLTLTPPLSHPTSRLSPLPTSQILSSFLSHSLGAGASAFRAWLTFLFYLHQFHASHPHPTFTPCRVPYYLVLYKIKGLCFFDKHTEEADGFAGGIEAAVAANRVLASYNVKLEKVSHAAHAMGPDYYDGVINVELDDDEQERIRVGGLNASMHNLLSAINIYKRGAASTDPRKRQSVAMRNEFLEAKQLEDEEEAARTRALRKAEEARKEAERATKQAEDEEAALLAEANSRNKGMFGGALSMVNKSRAVAKGEREAPKTKAAKAIAAFEQKSTVEVGRVEAGTARKGKTWVQRKPAWSTGRPPNLELPLDMQADSEKKA